MTRFFIILFLILLYMPSSAQAVTACQNITAYGADPSGSSPSNTAFTDAVAATDGTHICVYFPSGRYSFTTRLFVSLPNSSPNSSVTIKGDGSDTTELRFPSGSDGLVININSPDQSFHIDRLSVVTTAKSNSTNGIAVNNFSNSINSAQSHIDQVTVRGADGYTDKTSRWGIGINLYQISNTNLTNDTIIGSTNGASFATEGTCFIDRGTVAVFPIQINIIGSQFNFCHYGIVYGDYLQGLQITSSNFVGNGFGVFLSDKNVGNDQLAISSSQFNSSISDIYIGGLIDGVSITGNSFYGARLSGKIAIDIIKPYQFSIIGNAFPTDTGATNQDGIHIGPYQGASGVITGNVFSGPLVTAIYLRPNSQRVNIQSNSYSGVANNIVNSGANNMIGGGSS
ncbi:hypothetical protein C8J47_3794 [Sphingomonas sp. PP-F2F-G114-C0414]|nr:hypothetical protein C8J47_3794 [Sphingomonas sp. PP-F2F-G114-C0414]